MVYVGRKNELEYLLKLKDKNLIKVITGIRRCGKSTLLEMFQKQLIKNGVDKRLLHYYNFEESKLRMLKNWNNAYEYINKVLIKNKINYVFIDEPQSIDEFEKLLDGLFVNKNVDLYVTGSNAYFLSSQLATILTGRYIEIHLLPFSYNEYLLTNPNKTLNDYLNSTGFPEIINENSDSKIFKDYLNVLYKTVIQKDLLTKYEIRDKKQFENVVKFILKHIGSEVSSRNIANALYSNDNKVSHKTVDRYLTALKECFLIYEVPRFDIKGKKQLVTLDKYYCVDQGIRKALIKEPFREDIGHLLENAVYFELIRRDFEVSIGKHKNSEVDFVAQKNGETIYFQVAYTVKEKNIFEREVKPLKNIKDHFQKFIITTDEYEFFEEGIKVVNAEKWFKMTKSSDEKY